MIYWRAIPKNDQEFIQLNNNFNRVLGDVHSQSSKLQPLSCSISHPACMSSIQKSSQNIQLLHSVGTVQQKLRVTLSLKCILLIYSGKYFQTSDNAFFGKVSNGFWLFSSVWTVSAGQLNKTQNVLQLRFVHVDFQFKKKNFPDKKIEKQL